MDNSYKTWHQTIFLYLLYFSWILYTFSLIAYFEFHLTPLYNIINGFIKLYIGVILVYRFNPYFGKGEFTKFDRRLAYYAGFFLLISTVFVSFIETLLISIKKKVFMLLNS